MLYCGEDTKQMNKQELSSRCCNSQMGQLGKDTLNETSMMERGQSCKDLRGTVFQAKGKISRKEVGAKSRLKKRLSFKKLYPQNKYRLKSYFKRHAKNWKELFQIKI